MSLERFSPMFSIREGITRCLPTETTLFSNEYRGKISPHHYSNIYSKEHEISWLSFLLWTRGGLHITVP